MVSLFALVFIAIPITIYLIYLIFVTIKNVNSGNKYMIFGLHVSLIGGILALDNSVDLMGFEYTIVALGLIFSMIGTRKSN